MPAYMKLGDIKGEATALYDGALPVGDFTTLTGAAFINCAPVDSTLSCDSLVFQTTSVAGFDTVTLNFINVLTGATDSSTSFFAEGSFGGYGSFVSNDGGATLTISPVPEAGVWLMFILGFGVIGAALRRRRAPAAA